MRGLGFSTSATISSFVESFFVSIEIYSNKIYKVKYNKNDSNLLEFIY